MENQHTDRREHPRVRLHTGQVVGAGVRRGRTAARPARALSTTTSWPEVHMHGVDVVGVRAKRWARLWHNCCVRGVRACIVYRLCNLICQD